MSAAASADDWKTTCAARLESAQTEMAQSDAAFSRGRVTTEKDAVRFHLTDGAKSYSVIVTPTSSSSPARNSWNPPRDRWTDLPIIDKTYSTTKLNRFRFGKRLEASLLANRGDDSPRAPPVPKWLKKFVEIFSRALEDCLNL
jgi:hypothetical protein